MLNQREHFLLLKMNDFFTNSMPLLRFRLRCWLGCWCWNANLNSNSSKSEVYGAKSQFCSATVTIFFSGSFARCDLFSGLLKLPLELNFRLISTSVLINRDTPESYRKRSELWLIAMLVNNTIHQIDHHSMDNGLFSVLFLFVATLPLYLFRSIAIVDNVFTTNHPY